MYQKTKILYLIVIECFLNIIIAIFLKKREVFQTTNSNIPE